MADILITGANRGIGFALTRIYAERGDTVIATARDPATADALKELAKATGRVEIVGLDVTDPAGCDRLASALDGRGIDILVCNAGVLKGRGPVTDPAYTREVWLDQMITNVAGVFFTVRSLLPALGRGRSPRIAVISSVIGSSERAAGGRLAYRASKAAAVNLARNLAVELAPQGIAVGAYHPGWVKTDMGGSAADLEVAEGAGGLVTRIDALSAQTTDVFEDYRGQAIPF